MQEVINFPGVSVMIFGKEYTMPALSPYAYAKVNAGEKLASIQKELVVVQREAAKMEEELQNKEIDLSKVDTKNLSFSSESYVSMIELATLALKRNYPDITEEEVGNGIVDGMTLMGLMQHLISQNEKVKEEMAKYVKNVQK